MKTSSIKIVAIALFPLCAAGFALAQTQPGSFFKAVPAAKYPEFEYSQDPKILQAASENLAYFEGLENKEIEYYFGDRKVTTPLLIPTKAFIEAYKQAGSAKKLNEFIKKHFDLYQSVGNDGKGAVFYTSYYEPVTEASPVQTDEYKYPLYKRPPDLVKVDLGQFGDKWKNEKVWGRVQDGQLIPYFTREEIDWGKALEGKNLELAWFKARLQVFNIQMQGSSFIEFTNGKKMRLGSNGTNGYPFGGGYTENLIKLKLIANGNNLMARANEYIRNHPEMERKVLSQNKRYMFFKARNANASKGPTGAMGVSITGGRTIAVDTSVIPFGTIAFGYAPLAEFDNEGKFLGAPLHKKFLFCQDTGADIKGAARVDFFIGSGSGAEKITKSTAGNGKLYFLLVKD
ncbi:MAG: MltA domain-containing protein [Elusimicrobia bacterium]|nr:MltA domain-containing protein [Elusimicrobiota bacterium]